MKIQYVSDLHLEFVENSNWIKRNPIEPIGEILLVAGDTYYLGHKFTNHEWFDYASENWKYVFLIPGNHEFYKGADANICSIENYELKIRDNVFLLNNAIREIENIRFIFTALWSKIEKEKDSILRSLNDFRLIKLNGSKLTIDGFNDLHQKCWKFLQKELDYCTPKTKVVITHHLPSNLCNLEMYKDSLLNEAFCIDLTDEIIKSDVRFWIYGHSHGNVEDFNIGNTKMLTNQLGYIQEGGDKYFKGNKYFEVRGGSE